MNRNPLRRGSSRKVVSANIRYLMHHPHELTAKGAKMKHRQAIAIALRKAGLSRNPADDTYGKKGIQWYRGVPYSEHPFPKAHRYVYRWTDHQTKVSGLWAVYTYSPRDFTEVLRGWNGSEGPRWTFAKVNPGGNMKRRRRNPHQTHIDHAGYKAKVRTMSDAALRYTLKDAAEAIKAHPTGHKAGYYADEIHYASEELRRRKRNPGAKMRSCIVTIRRGRKVKYLRVRRNPDAPAGVVITEVKAPTPTAPPVVPEKKNPDYSWTSEEFRKADAPYQAYVKAKFPSDIKKMEARLGPSFIPYLKKVNQHLRDLGQPAINSDDSSFLYRLEELFMNGIDPKAAASGGHGKWKGMVEVRRFHAGHAAEDMALNEWQWLIQEWNKGGRRGPRPEGSKLLQEKIKANKAQYAADLAKGKKNPSVDKPAELWIKDAEHHERRGNKASELACYKRAAARAKRDGQVELRKALVELIENLTGSWRKH